MLRQTIFVISALIGSVAAEESQCAGGAALLYARAGQETKLKAAEALVASLSDKLSDEYMLKRWDDVDGTYAVHLDWMYRHARKYTDSAVEGFRHYGEHSGITYEINDALTERGGGDGYFRLTGEVDISAELLIAQVLTIQLGPLQGLIYV